MAQERESPFTEAPPGAGAVSFTVSGMPDTGATVMEMRPEARFLRGTDMDCIELDGGSPTECVIDGLPSDSADTFELELRLVGDLSSMPTMTVSHDNGERVDELLVLNPVPAASIDTLCANDLVAIADAVGRLTPGTRPSVMDVCYDPGRDGTPDPYPYPLAADSINVAAGVEVSGISDGDTRLLTISVTAVTSEDDFLEPAGLLDCNANRVGDGAVCMLPVSAPGVHFIPFILRPDRPPGFFISSPPGGTQAQIGQDPNVVGNPVGVDRALHTTDNTDAMTAMAVDVTVTVDVGVGTEPPSVTRLPVRWESSDADVADAVHAAMLGNCENSDPMEVTVDKIMAGELCLTDLGTYPTSCMPAVPRGELCSEQEVEVPVSFTFPAGSSGKRATLFFGRHEVVIEHAVPTP